MLTYPSIHTFFPCAVVVPHLDPYLHFHCLLPSPFPPAIFNSALHLTCLYRRIPCLVCQYLFGFSSLFPAAYSTHLAAYSSYTLVATCSQIRTTTHLLASPVCICALAARFSFAFLRLSISLFYLNSFCTNTSPLPLPTPTPLHHYSLPCLSRLHLWLGRQYPSCFSDSATFDICDPVDHTANPAVPTTIRSTSLCSASPARAACALRTVSSPCGKVF